VLLVEPVAVRILTGLQVVHPVGNVVCQQETTAETLDLDTTQEHLDIPGLDMT
jgi:hypothetical protein